MLTPKDILYSDEARRKILKGVKKLAGIVKVTIGAKGRNVMYEVGTYRLPVVTNDGVTIARQVALDDHFERMGAEFLKKAAMDTNDIAGDGTTTVTVLAEALVEEGVKHLLAGSNALAIRKGMAKAKNILIEELKKMAIPVVEEEDIIKAATLSAQSKELGTTITKAIREVGKYGVVTTDFSSSFNPIDVEYKKGMMFDKGFFKTAALVTDNQKLTATLEDVRIILTNQRVNALSDLQPIVEKLVTSGKKNILLIAQMVDGEAMAFCTLNFAQGNFAMIPAEAPGNGGQEIYENLKDIAIMTGGVVYAPEEGRKIQEATLEELGKADRIVIGKNKTEIIGGKGDEKAIQDRITELKKEVEEEEDEFLKERKQQRLARFTGGVAILKVGGAGEAETKERYHKVEDAIGATRAAIEEGVVTGGGAALIHASKAISLKEEEDGDVRTGMEIVKKAIEKPAYYILRNAGLKADYIIAKILSNPEASYGINVETNMLGNAAEWGIVDPLKVTRTALESAVSAASSLLTTEGAICFRPADEKKSNKKLQQDLM